MTFNSKYDVNDILHSMNIIIFTTATVFFIYLLQKHHNNISLHRLGILFFLKHDQDNTFTKTLFK